MLSMQAALQSAIDDFLAAKSSRAKKTVAFYAVPLRQLAAYCDRWPPTDTAINAYLVDVRARGCAQATLYAYWRAIENWLAWFEARGRLDKNPISLVEKPRRPRRRVPRAPPRDALRRFFDAIEAGDGWRAVRDLALFTGLRGTSSYHTKV